MVDIEANDIAVGVKVGDQPRNDLSRFGAGAPVSSM